MQRDRVREMCRAEDGSLADKFQHMPPPRVNPSSSEALMVPMKPSQDSIKVFLSATANSYVPRMTSTMATWTMNKNVYVNRKFFPWQECWRVKRASLGAKRLVSQSATTATHAHVYNGCAQGMLRSCRFPCLSCLVSRSPVRPLIIHARQTILHLRQCSLLLACLQVRDKAHRSVSLALVPETRMPSCTIHLVLFQRVRPGLLNIGSRLKMQRLFIQLKTASFRVQSRKLLEVASRNALIYSCIDNLALSVSQTLRSSQITLCNKVVIQITREPCLHQKLPDEVDEACKKHDRLRHFYGRNERSMDRACRVLVEFDD